VSRIPNTGSSIGLCRCCDTGCTARIRIFFHPISQISQIKQQQIKFSFSCSHRFHKLENYLFFEKIQKNICQLTKNFGFFKPTNSYQALRKYGLKPRSEIQINFFPDSDSGVQKFFIQKNDFYCITKNSFVISSGSAWIRINLSCWIRIHINKMLIGYG
jgi:hypothetical protein